MSIRQGLRNFVTMAGLLFFANTAAQYIIPNNVKNSFDPKLRRSLSKIIEEEVDSTTTLGYIILKEENPREARFYSSRIEGKLIDKTRDYINENIHKNIEDYTNEDKTSVFERIKGLIKSELRIKYNENILFLSYSLRKGKANCYALENLYWINGNALGLPIWPVSIPQEAMPPGKKGHMFVRWDLDGKHDPLNPDNPVNKGDVNWECSSGAEISDKFYIDKFELDEKDIEEKGALKTLNMRESLILAFRLIADNYIQNKNLGEKEQRIFDHMLELDPNNYFALHNKSTCLITDRRYAELIPVLERMNMAKASDYNHYFLGVARCETGDTTGAMDEFESAISINSEHDKANLRLGDIMVRKKQYDKAIVFYNEAIRINPKDYAAYHNMSVAYHNMGIEKQGKGDYEGAKLDFEKAKEVKRKYRN